MALQTVSHLFGVLSAMLTLPIFTHRANVDLYGEFTQLTVTINLLAPLIVMSLDVASIRFLASVQDREVVRQHFQSVMVWLVGCSAVVWGLVYLLRGAVAELILGSSQYADLIVLADLLLFVTVLQWFPINFFRARLRTNYYSLVSILMNIVEIVLIFIALQPGSGLVPLLYALIALRFGAFLVTYVIFSRAYGGVTFQWHVLREMLKFSLPVTPLTLLRWVLNYADRLVIIQILTLTSVGVYATAYSLALVLNVTFMPISVIIYPIVSKLWDEQRMDDVRQIFSLTFQYYLLIAIPACLGLSYLSTDLIKLLASDSFVASPLVVFFISAGLILMGFIQLYIYVFHLVKKPQRIIVAMGSAAVLNIALNLILVPGFGLEGAAFASLVTYATAGLMLIYFGRHYIPFSVNPVGIARNFVAAGAMLVALSFLRHDTIIFMVLSILTGAAVYLGVCFLLGAFSRRDMRTLRLAMAKSEVGKIARAAS
jgi:O-antigen/teichoic acid export membrane protein